MSSGLGPEWRLSTEGLKTVNQNGSVTDKNKLIKNALDTDLKEIGSPCLTEELAKDRTGKIVLQIQKVRNIAAPKANEGSQAAPRMFKLVLTDGIAYAQAVETAPIPSLSRDKTPPGTKVVLNGAKIISGFILINPNNCTILGGKVPHLVEKWELAKSVQAHSRQTSYGDGAPPWVSFGTRIPTSQDSQFKSLDNKSKDLSKENTEFDQLRNDAIAEVSTGAVRKVFGGGGVKQTVQNNYQGNNNNANNRRVNTTEGNPRDKNNRQSRGKSNIKIEAEEKPLKPSERVSLFAFLEDKLPIPEVTSMSSSINNKFTSQNSVPAQINSNFSNRQSYPNNKQKFQNNSYQQQNNYNSYNNYNRRDNSQRYDDVNSYKGKSNNPPLPQTNANQRQIQNNWNNSQRQPQNNSNRYEANERLGDHKNFQNNSNRYDANSYQKPAQNNYNRYEGNPNYRQPQYSNFNRYEMNLNQKPGGQNNSANNVEASYNNQRQVQTQNNSNDLCDGKTKGTKQQQSIQDSKQSNSVETLTNTTARMSLNSEFATRSLRQHLNLNTSNKKNVTNVSGTVSSPVINKTSNSPNMWNWKEGDPCLAKYWEDGRYYDAVVTAITDKTCVVKFSGYGNIEEVLKQDCLPVTNTQEESGFSNSSSNNQGAAKPYTGSLEFRRSARTFSRK